MVYRSVTVKGMVESSKWKLTADEKNLVFANWLVPGRRRRSTQSLLKLREVEVRGSRERFLSMWVQGRRGIVGGSECGVGRTLTQQ